METDHKTLETIYGPRSRPCARIERWVLTLQLYDFSVMYRPGRANIADPLSRLLHRGWSLTIMSMMRKNVLDLLL